MKDLFLSENSRLWWAWLIVSFPLIGGIVGAIELKKSNRPVNLSSLFSFIFPGNIYKSRSFRNDLQIVFLLYAFYALVLVLIASIESKAIIGKSIVFFNSGILDHLSLASYKDLSPISIANHLFFTFLVILSYDFGFTMLHFAFHKIPVLWRFHKLHHSAEVLNPLTVARFHLVEYIAQKMVEGITIGLVFGVFYYFHPQQIDLYKVFGLSIFGILFSSIGVFRHSHIWISYGFLNYIFCSPAMHQIHHSTEARHIDKNMSQVFSFWDYFLGTLYVPKTRENFSVGLSDEKDWNSIKQKKLLSIHFRA